jgi:hypothetical protein
MNTRSLDRRYAALEADERFRLAVKASARDDEPELRRLYETATRKRYEASDLDFHDRLDAARLLAALVVGELRPYFARVGALRAASQVTRALFATALEALAAQEGETAPRSAERAAIKALDDESFLEGIFEKPLVEDRAVAAAAWYGFDQLCRDELGLDGLTVVGGAFGGDFLEMRRAQIESLAAVEPDAERVAESRAVFAKRWDFGPE